MWQHFEGSGISRCGDISRKYGIYCIPGAYESPEGWRVAHKLLCIHMPICHHILNSSIAHAQKGGGLAITSMLCSYL